MGSKNSRVSLFGLEGDGFQYEQVPINRGYNIYYDISRSRRIFREFCVGCEWNLAPNS